MHHNQKNKAPKQDIPQNQRQNTSTIHTRQTRRKQLRQNKDTTIQTTLPERKTKIQTNTQTKKHNNRLLQEHDTKTQTKKINKKEYQEHQIHQNTRTLKNIKTSVHQYNRTPVQQCTNKLA